MLHLQDGLFDRPDRLFVSVLSSWQSCLNNAADVRELIPEFFSGDGAFLENSHGLDLGVTQAKQRVNDVILPPYGAFSSPLVSMPMPMPILCH